MSPVRVIIPNRERKEYPGNLTPFVTIACIFAAMGGLIFGYDIGISGTYYKYILHQPNKDVHSRQVWFW
jgi:hypothetical protein